MWYLPIVGTKKALVAVADSITSTDGAKDLIADIHLSAFYICSVGILTAVHLPKECTAKVSNSPLHETVGFFFSATAQNFAGNLVSSEPFLQQPLHTAGDKEERAISIHPPRWGKSVAVSYSLGIILQRLSTGPSLLYACILSSATLLLLFHS